MAARSRRAIIVPVRDRTHAPSATKQLDEDLVYTPRSSTARSLVPNQIRTVLEPIATSCSPNCSPAATEVPKTLIFAKDDNHAEEIVRIVREVFGKGNDFAKKITYRRPARSPRS